MDERQRYFDWINVAGNFDETEVWIGRKSQPFQHFFFNSVDKISNAEIVIENKIVWGLFASKKLSSSILFGNWLTVVLRKSLFHYKGWSFVVEDQKAFSWKNEIAKD